MRRSVTAARMTSDEAIVLDGLLDEPAWRRAVPATDFIQQDPDLGGPPTERTEVRFIFNRDSLYMGVLCFDSEPDKLLGNTVKLPPVGMDTSTSSRLLPAQRSGHEEWDREGSVRAGQIVGIPFKEAESGVPVADLLRQPRHQPHDILQVAE